jgi:putative protease
MQKLELLSPAKNLDCGIIAINHGADAVYIGVSKYSARSAAGNSVADIRKLIEYAHRFNAKVYVAFNTILFDSELEEAQKLIQQFYNEGADALIIQDMGILEMDIPPIPLFASTQTNNRSWEKALFLEKSGFQRVILARELSLAQINEIRKNTTIDLEFFVHGSLCVSFSGQCYMSFHKGHRSSNRGECGQPCRLKYSLYQSDKKLIVKDKHLLSLRDLNLSHSLSDLAEAGITSFKIEGRLKDEEYIKNITTYYRKALDNMMENNQNYSKTSSGKTFFDFTPSLEKTFNRNFTDYFLKGRKKDTGSILTPKFIGDEIGKVKKTSIGYFETDTQIALHNGDGLSFFNKNGELCGLRVSKTEGKKVYTNNHHEIFAGAVIFRNFDQEFTKQLQQSKTVRKIAAQLFFTETETGFSIRLRDEDANEIELSMNCQKEAAKNSELAYENIRKQLNKTGDTIFIIDSLEVNLTSPYFIPISFLNKLRREAFELLETKRINTYQNFRVLVNPNDYPYPIKKVDYKANISNQLARQFYERHGVTVLEDGYEKTICHTGKLLMNTKYCILYQLDMCKKQHPDLTTESLIMTDGKDNYRLEFDCDNCEMLIYAGE